MPPPPPAVEFKFGGSDLTTATTPKTSTDKSTSAESSATEATAPAASSLFVFDSAPKDTTVAPPAAMPPKTKKHVSFAADVADNSKDTILPFSFSASPSAFSFTAKAPSAPPTPAFAPPKPAVTAVAPEESDDGQSAATAEPEKMGDAGEDNDAVDKGSEEKTEKSEEKNPEKEAEEQKADSEDGKKAMPVEKEQETEEMPAKTEQAEVASKKDGTEAPAQLSSFVFSPTPSFSASMPAASDASVSSFTFKTTAPSPFGKSDTGFGKPDTDASFSFKSIVFFNYPERNA